MFENVPASLARDIWIGHTEVVEHRSFEQRGTLEDCSDLPAQRGRWHCRQRHAAPRDHTVNRVIEAIEETEQRRLSRSGRSNDQSDSLFGQIDGDVSKNRGFSRARGHLPKRESGSISHTVDRTPLRRSGPCPHSNPSQNPTQGPNPGPHAEPRAELNDRPDAHGLAVQRFQMTRLLCHDERYGLAGERRSGARFRRTR